jgi:hypothetical protein
MTSEGVFQISSGELLKLRLRTGLIFSPPFT